MISAQNQHGPSAETSVQITSDRIKKKLPKISLYRFEHVLTEHPIPIIIISTTYIIIQHIQKEMKN